MSRIYTDSDKKLMTEIVGMFDTILEISHWGNNFRHMKEDVWKKFQRLKEQAKEKGLIE